MNDPTEREARPTADLLTLIADDKSVVTYRPRWNQLTGSVTASILLQQIIYRWVGSKRQPFYKFLRPCDHPLCRPGDTWEEELGLTRREFETARSHIAIRTRGEIDPGSLISYWVTTGHCTWYAVNEALLVEKLSALYPADLPAAVGIQLPLPAEPMHKSANGDGGNVQRQWRKRTTPMAETYIGIAKPMADSAIANGGNAQQINKDDLKDDQEQRGLKEHTATATAAPAASAASAPPLPAVAAVENVTPVAELPAKAPDPREDILRWIDFGDRLTAQERAGLDPPTLLAWAYWILLEEAKPTRPRNAIALARSQWRKGLQPRDDLLALARTWLDLNDDDRRAVLDGCEFETQWGHAGGEFEGIDVPITAALAVYRATAGELAPPSLTPPAKPRSSPAAPVKPLATSPSLKPDTDANHLWKAALAELELQMTRATFATWLQGTTAVETGDGFTVIVRNKFAVDWLENRLHPLIERTVGSVAGRTVMVRYEVLRDEPAAREVRR